MTPEILNWQEIKSYLTELYSRFYIPVTEHVQNVLENTIRGGKRYSPFLEPAPEAWLQWKLGGGVVFIYSHLSRRISFEIVWIKEKWTIPVLDKLLN